MQKSTKTRPKHKRKCACMQKYLCKYVYIYRHICRYVCVWIYVSLAARHFNSALQVAQSAKKKLKNRQSCNKSSCGSNTIRRVCSVSYDGGNNSVILTTWQMPTIVNSIRAARNVRKCELWQLFWFLTIFIVVLIHKRPLLFIFIAFRFSYKQENNKKTVTTTQQWG